MQVRITTLRLALAAFVSVLGGVGIATLLSPLVGTASATAGQLVNVSDPTAAYTARVDATGALKTAGLAAPTLPRLPFNSSTTTYIAAYTKVLGPTTATVALTDLKIANHYINTGARALYFIQYSAAAPNTGCGYAHIRQLGLYDVAARDSIHANFETPLVVKPLANGEAWCLRVYMTAPPGDTNNGVGVSVGGYVPSGVFVPAQSSTRTPESGAAPRKK
jgi:hypothetical protein